MRALAIAATGMSAQQTNVEVIANNIANINTTASSAPRAEFTDLLYQAERLAGRAQPRRRERRCRKAPSIGLGVAHGRRPQPAHPGAAGQYRQPARPGAQRPRLVPDRRRRTARRSTRAPAPSTRTPTGQLVTARRLRRASRRSPFPPDTVDVVVNEIGPGLRHASAARPAPQQLGQLTLANFANEPASSRSAATSIARPPPPARPMIGVPGDPGFGTSAGLSRGLQRRSGQGDHRADLGAARLRDELQGHPGGRRDGRAPSPRACAEAMRVAAA